MSIKAAGATTRPVALSPSRAVEFKNCPLLYRFRTIDRLPELSSPAAARGTLVHAVLEELFGRPAGERTVEAAAEAVLPTWERLTAADPSFAEAVAEPTRQQWLASAEPLLRSYFQLEDPTRFSAESRELLIEVDLDGALPLRGFIDRLDVAATGEVRVVDYKTGQSPGESFELSALYQLKFYALMILRTRGVVPVQLKLLYLGNGRELTYAPDEAELLAFERSLGSLWDAIQLARRTGDFQPHKGRMCSWCSFQSLCPEYGGTPPPYPGDPADGDLATAIGDDPPPSAAPRSPILSPGESRPAARRRAAEPRRQRRQHRLLPNGDQQ
ncbi:MAG: RecB family exonuclease [Actinomycetota bacterium]|nr:RecB family exonuclease [Actinomycetota bacterium]